MIELPQVVYAVIVSNVRDGEWLDFGSLRPEVDQSRAAYSEFASKASTQWRADNKPVKIKRLTLAEEA